jgi:hypothetical protein
MMRAGNGDFLTARTRYGQVRLFLSVGFCLGFGLATMAYPVFTVPVSDLLTLGSMQFAGVGLFITLGAGVISRRVCAHAGGLAVVALAALFTAALFCLITTLGCP